MAKSFPCSHRPPVRHNSHNRSIPRQLDELLMPAEQHAHLLAGPALAKASRLDLREARGAGGLGGDGLAGRWGLGTGARG